MLASSTTRSASSAPFKPLALPREVQPHLAEFERFFSSQIETFEPHLRELVRYVFANQGKRIRPTLVFCSGWTDNGRIVPDQVYAAAVVELIHLATLVHDDVLDGAMLRHQLPTASRKFGASVAVLLGDALLTQALKIASDSLSIEVCRAMASATRRVCAGEIHQTLERGNPRFSVNEYFEVIAMKTGELFAVSCLLGARVAGHPEEFVDAASRFGLQLGIAYQLFDDLADFCGDEGKIGKTLGTDLASGKFTLPLLCLIERLPETEAAELRRDVLAGLANVKDLAGRMHQHGVLKTVRERFEAELRTGKEALAQWDGLPATARLLDLAAYVNAQVARLLD
jgi:octaprenyl-diphosphate synthase